MFLIADDTPVRMRDRTEEIPEYTAEEERRDSKSWKLVQIADMEFCIDMRVIEPYKRVLSHGGECSSLLLLSAFCGIREIRWARCCRNTQFGLKVDGKRKLEQKQKTNQFTNSGCKSVLLNNYNTNNCNICCGPWGVTRNKLNYL